jgi:GNAT superfamily N-acetyltransferase
MNTIRLIKDYTPALADIIELYHSAELNRPLKDIKRIEKMYHHSNLIVTAWDEDLLVGVARSLSDFCYCCYVSDLAVRKHYQKRGVGKKLLEYTKAIVGEQSNLILLSAPEAVKFYQKIGMESVDNGFITKREY